ncbi:MAG: tetratricopeptide repeat protein [Deltaproteobacteria bacterium]|nr:tetratricopeptide repeat protein [Deltaproteobacteria bacterium]
MARRGGRLPVFADAPAFRELTPQRRVKSELRAIAGDAERRARFESELERALAAGPHNKIARLVQAHWSEALGDPRGAMRQLEALAGEYPDFYDGQSDLGKMLLADGDPESAARHFARAARLIPDSPQAWNNLGVAQWQSGDPAGAKRSFERALKHDPDLREAKDNLEALAAARR